MAIQLVGAGLPAQDLARRLRDALPAQPLKLANDRKVRSWQRYLVESDGPGIRDELPEVLLGRGISAQAANIALPAALTLTPDEWELGRECELRAAGYDQPLPTYIRALVAAG